MRIIDNRHDFYDYLQDPTDNLVFDRRNAYILTKEDVCTSLNVHMRRDSSYAFVLMQCCHTFWLFLFKVTRQKEAYYWSYGSVKDYDIMLLDTWRNYDLPRKLISLDIIEFGFNFYDYNERDYNFKKIIDNAANIRDAINHKDFAFKGCIANNDVKEVSKKTKGGKTIVEKEIKIPILNSTKISTVVDPRDIFYSIEEYFSLEKSDSERIEPIGATNDDKIVMHGFDTKVSFRG